MHSDDETIFHELEDGSYRTRLTAAYLLEYWAKKGVIPRYSALIDGLRKEDEDSRSVRLIS